MLKSEVSLSSVVSTLWISVLFQKSISSQNHEPLLGFLPQNMTSLNG